MSFGFFDNPERRARWQDILRDYSPSGYRVQITYPIQATGTIIDQMTIGGEHNVATQPGAFFRVQLDDPIPFGSYALRVLQNDPGKMAAVKSQLKNMGCLARSSSGYDYINCLFVQWPHMVAIDIKPGQPLEYVEGDQRWGALGGTKTTLGIAQSVKKVGDRTIVEFFLLEPLTWYRAPLAIETDFLKASHVSRWVTAMTVDGIYRDWKEKDPSTLPKGSLSEDKNEYVLDQPMDIAQAYGFCDRNFSNPETRLRCRLEASLFHIVPIDANHSSGTFRIMRQEHAGYIVPYVVTREDVEKWAHDASSGQPEGEPDDDQ